MQELRGKGAFTKISQNTAETVHQTDKSYSLFMTSFSMPSIAFSKSASEQFFHTSHSRICVAINYQIASKRGGLQIRKNYPQQGSH